MNRLTTTAIVSLCSSFGMMQAVQAEEINALVWCDHSDPALIEPFETATGIKVNLKEYEGRRWALPFWPNPNRATGTFW